MSRWMWWPWVSAGVALGACREEPPSEPWCACSALVEGRSIELRVHPQPLEGFAPYQPQTIQVYVGRGAQPTLELETQLANDGALLDAKNVGLQRVAPNRYQLRLEGWKQPPACYRVAHAGKLQLEPCAPGTDVACRYRALRPDH